MIRDAVCMFLFASAFMFIPGLMMFIFGCDQTIACPLYENRDATVQGYHTDANNCYIRQINSYVPCYSMFVSYVFEGGRCDNYLAVYSYDSSNDNYGYAINQTRRVYVSKVDGTCGISNAVRSISIGGVIFMAISGILLIVALILLAVIYYKTHSENQKREKKGTKLTTMTTPIVPTTTASTITSAMDTFPGEQMGERGERSRHTVVTFIESA